MNTVIQFVGDSALVVTESLSEVQAAFNAEGGLPFRVTLAKTGGSAYVNPANVAYWFEREERAGQAQFL